MPSKARTICNRDGPGKALVLDNLGPLLPGLLLTKDDIESYFKRLSGIKYKCQEE